MSAQLDREMLATVPPAVPRAGLREWRAAALVALGVALFTLAGAWMQERIHVNHDVSWILHSAGWLLEGKRFGSDIIDVNPPLIWFYSLPAAAIVKAGLLPEPDAIRLYTWVLCLGALALSYRVLAPLRAAGRLPEAAAIVLGAAFSVAIVSISSFAQREFLAVSFGMPYCLLIAGRLEYGAKFSRGLAVAVGVVAAIGFGFKPWLLSVPILLELLQLARSRNLRSVWRPETIALGGALAAYLLAIVVFTPGYLTETLPIARATYWAYDRVNWMTLWTDQEKPLTLLIVAALLLLVSRSMPAYAWALLCAVAGFQLNYWMQRKGFVYHLYPVLASQIMLAAYAGACASRAIVSGKYRARRSLLIAGAWLIALFTVARVADWVSPAVTWLARYDMNSGYEGVKRSLLVAKVNEVAAQGSYAYAISPYPYPSAPLMSYTHAEWPSAYPAQFTALAAARSHMVTDPEKLAAVTRAVQLQRQHILRDFERYQPAIVLVNRAIPRRTLGPQWTKFNLLNFYLEDPGFAAVWRNYREVETIEDVRVFVRNP